MEVTRRVFCRRQIYVLGLYRTKWTWSRPWEALLRKSSPSKVVDTASAQQGTDPLLSHMDRLRAVAWSHLGEMEDDLWKTASLGSIDTKGKILCECEKKFNVNMPDQILGPITTFKDLLQYLENYQPPKEIPRIYPLHQAAELPSNLNIQFISTERAPRKTRVPYDNVGVIRHQVSSRGKIRIDYNKKVRTEPSRREKIQMMKDRVWY